MKKFPDYGEGQHIVLPSHNLIILTAGKCASSTLKRMAMTTKDGLIKTDSRNVAVSEGFLKIAVYRDPIERLKSCWRDKVRRHFYRGFKSMPGMVKGMHFNKFARKVGKISDDESDGHFRSQHCFYFHGGKPLFNILLDFNTFFEDWKFIQSLIPELPDLGRNKRNTRERQWLQPDDIKRRVLRILKRRYKFDFEMKRLITHV